MGLVLEFVYGDVHDGVLRPIDRQQRLAPSPGDGAAADSIATQSAALVALPTDDAYAPDRVRIG